jgi:hypothetical protein
MTEQQWRIAAEVVHEAETACEQVPMKRLAVAVRELNIPASVLDRMQLAVTAAVARAFQDESTRAAGVRILTRALQPADWSAARSWGFFLVERGTSGGERCQIEVFVYPDGS